MRFNITTKNTKMKNYFFLVLTMTILAGSTANAQRVRIGVGGGFGYGYGYPRPYGQTYPRKQQQRRNQNLPKFEPSVILSFGYGFPNVDKNYLSVFYNYYKGNISQTGPFTGAIDYRFSRSMSIGAMVTHGTVSVPYYNYNTNAKSFTGNLDNWSVMLNFVNYIPVNTTAVTPYVRAAIGINTWKEDYADASGNKVTTPDPLPDLAYQVGIGAKFNMSKNAGLFLEAGYGKYILHGGIAFKF